MECALQNSHDILLNKLRESIDNLHIGLQAYSHLHEQIIKLHESKEALLGQLSLRNIEFETMQRESENIRNQLRESQYQLNEKKAELGTHKELSATHQQLIRQLKDTQDHSASLEMSLKSAKEEISLWLDKLRFERENSAFKEKKCRQELESAEQTIKGLTDDKRNFIAECKLVADSVRQEASELADAERAALTIRHEIQVQDLEERCVNAEKSLQETMGELLRRKQECDRNESRISDLERKLSQRELERVKILGKEEEMKEIHDRVWAQIQDKKSEIAGLRELIDSVRHEMRQEVEAAQQYQEEINNRLNWVYRCDGESETIPEHHANVHTVDKVNNDLSSRSEAINRPGILRCAQWLPMHNDRNNYESNAKWANRTIDCPGITYHEVSQRLIPVSAELSAEDKGSHNTSAAQIPPFSSMTPVDEGEEYEGTSPLTDLESLIEDMEPLTKGNDFKSPLTVPDTTKLAIDKDTLHPQNLILSRANLDLGRQNARRNEKIEDLSPQCTELVAQTSGMCHTTIISVVNI